MPFRHVIDPGQGLAVITLTGDVTVETLLDAMHAFLSDAAWKPGTDRLFDWHGVETIAIEGGEMRRYVQTAKATSKLIGGRTAVVTGDALHERVCEVYGVAVPWPLQLFRTRDEALAWLGIHSFGG